jgi:hypothetical protein
MNYSANESKNEYWKEHITRFQQSGQSRREYCLAEKITYRVFSYWLKKTETTQNEKLIKIPHKAHQQISTCQSFIEIIVKEKISIRISQNFDGELLRDVINELGIQL